MKYFITHIVLLLFTLNLYSQQVKDPTYQRMLSKLLDHSVPEISVYNVEDEDTSIVYLDAREREEYEVSHIRNAVWVGYDDFDIKRVKEISKGAEIIVYCSVGYRSEKIAEKLLSAGYTNISNLYGGIFEWINGNRPVYEEDNNETTKRIHPYDEDWGAWLSRGEKSYAP